MIDRLHHQLEMSGETATLYLAGSLTLDDTPILCALCADLPQAIRTLRLDLLALAHPDRGAMDAVRALVRDWRTARHGEFRIAMRGAPMAGAPRGGASGRIASVADDAQQAVYL